MSPAEDTPDPRRWRILAVLLVAIFMSLVGVSIINVVLPSIQRGLEASDSELQWVLTGYALTFGVVLVAAGRAGDILGRGPLFIVGVALFTLSSVAGGLAPDPLSLNIARVVQGLGSGLLNPQAVGMIQQYFRGAERGRAYGALGSVIGVSVAIGPVIGGLIVQLAGEAQGWRWTFLVNVPVGIAAIVLALRWLPRPLRNPREAGARSVIRDLDPVGAVLLGLAVLALLLPFVERTLGPGGWLVLPVGLGLLGLWVWWERRYRDRGHAPMVDLALFRVRSFSTGTLIAGLYFMGVTSVWVLVALYVQNGLGRSALEAGLIGMPAAVLSAFTANWSGRRVGRHGRRIVVAGICSAIVGLGLSIAVVQLVDAERASVWWMLLTLAFVGGAQGLVITPNQTITLGEVPLEYSGSAGGVLQTGQRIGTAMGLGIITAVAFAVLDGGGWPLAVTAGFATTAGLLLVTLVIAVVDVRGERRPTA
ncbi:MFS transporter [Georgenia phoenicis]|uniref:MFS transporter n=1 Tax=unclassified Georgenia TaxID=2626815 RepID=UPI0039B00D37